VLGCKISSFCQGVDEVLTLVGCYVAYVVSCLPKISGQPADPVSVNIYQHNCVMTQKREDLVII